MEGKICRRCGELKPIAVFTLRKGTKYRHPYCNPCRTVINRKIIDEARENARAHGLLTKPVGRRAVKRRIVKFFGKEKIEYALCDESVQFITYSLEEEARVRELAANNPIFTLTQFLDYGNFKTFTYTFPPSRKEMQRAKPIERK